MLCTFFRGGLQSFSFVFEHVECHHSIGYPNARVKLETLGNYGAQIASELVASPRARQMAIAKRIADHKWVGVIFPVHVVS